MFDYTKHLIPSETLAITYLLDTKDVVEEDDTPYPYGAAAYLPVYSAITTEVMAIYHLTVPIID